MKILARTPFVSLASLLAMFSSGALHAAVSDLEALQSGEGSLAFQYGFEGGSLADGSGNGVTLQAVAGSAGGDTANIQFVNGYNGGSSQAYKPAFDTSGYQIGAGLNTVSAAVNISSTVTVESVVQFDSFTLPTGGSGAYIVSARPTSGRAYFYRQLAGGDGRLTTTLGDTFGDTVDSYNPYTASDWYYVAMVASYDSGANLTTVTMYGANLSENETTLSVLNSDGALFNGDWTGTSQVGIGNFTNGSQEYLQGAIDNVAFYNSNLSQGTLQTHLDALLIPVPEPSVTLLGGLGLLGLLRRRRD